MKTKLLIALSLSVCFLLFAGIKTQAQKLPDMGLSRYVFVQSMQVDNYTFDIRDTATECFAEGHWICEVVNGQCKRQRIIKYGTLLFNGGDTVGVYGACVLPNCQYDFCHGHDHFTEGIKVLLERWNPTTGQWMVVSFNSKLDYAMANDTKYPADYVRIPGTNNHEWRLSYLYNEADYMANTGGVMDSSLARTRDAVWHPSYDQFYTYQTVDYNSNNRGIVNGYGDLYWYVEGNWNHTDSVDGFYRFTAWHNPPFAQKTIWPDTISTIFYLEGDSFVSRDTSLPIVVYEPDTIPSSIVAIVIDRQGTNDIGNGELTIAGVDFPIEVHRHWIRGANRISVGYVPIIVYSNVFVDNTRGEFVWKCNGVTSNAVKIK